ncbi:MAG TPA: rhomboid family intramembrane serine protease [Gemmataceae bacterium]|nr:rhomboid family intramembrane serine protease [Gemmataceae bacterium]
MSEAGLHPLEMILRLCASVAPEPWYPRLFAKQEGVDRQALGQCLEELWLNGLIERAAGTEESGPAITLTREGQRILLDPEALERLRAGEPMSSTDRGAIIRGALRGQMRPIVTIVLVLINVVVFAWGYLDARTKNVDNDFLRGSVGIKGPPTAEELRKQNEVFHIQEKSGSVSAYNLVDGQWWRLLTAGFVHIGFLHLLMNMAVLYSAGRFIEQMWGHVRYLVIYLSAVLGGSCLAAAHTVGPMAGASGGVCGLLAAEAVWFFFNRRYLPRTLFRRARTIFLVNLVLLIFISSFRNVSGWGHFGGAAAGALTAILLQLHRFGPPAWRWLALIGFVPMAWYGHYAIAHARATDPRWFAVEDKQFMDRHATPVLQAMKKAWEVYFEKVKPVLETHPTRRDAAKVDAVFPIIEEQKRALTSRADELARAGPYHSAEAEEAREVGREFVLATVELFNLAEHLLHLGEDRTDKDRRALREQEKQVEEKRREWRNLFEQTIWRAGMLTKG